MLTRTQAMPEAWRPAPGAGSSALMVNVPWSFMYLAGVGLGVPEGGKSVELMLRRGLVLSTRK